MGGEADAPASGKRARHHYGAPECVVPQPQTLIDALDDGCLLKILAFLSPMPGEYSTDGSDPSGQLVAAGLYLPMLVSLSAW